MPGGLPRIILGARKGKSQVMRLTFSGYLLGFFAAVLVLTAGEVALQAAPEDELLSIVEKSCKRACVGGRGEKAFCGSYCQCVSQEIEKLADQSDITRVLQEQGQQDAVINQCSGRTAMTFFAASCREKCSGVPRCDSYCSCLEGKIKVKQDFSEIGTFFIQLGKNDASAVKRLEGFEAACSR